MRKITGILILAALLLASFCGCTLENKPVLSAIGGGDTGYNVGSGEVSEKIEKIDIDWASGSVTLKRDGGNTIRIDEPSEKLEDWQKVHWRVEGTTLHILFDQPSAVDFLNLGWGSQKKLTVTVPESLLLDEYAVGAASAEINGSAEAKTLAVDTASGGVKLDCVSDDLRVGTASGGVELNCRAERISVDTASGAVVLRQSGEAKRVEIETASGKMEAVLGTVAELNAESSSGNVHISADSVTKADVDTSSGKVTMELGGAPDELEIETASGDVNLTLPKDADFTVEVDTASGDFTCEFPVLMNGNSYTCGNGSGKISIDTASGDITIQKRS